MTNSWATIKFDQQAIRHNVQRVRDYAPNTKILAMIKSNAYGHGLLEVAQCLEGVDAFGVARLSEAVTLREAGFQKAILLVAGVLNAKELELAIEHRLWLTVHSDYQLSLLEKTQCHLPIWLKVDTGMGRLGFLPDDFSKAYVRASALTDTLVVFSHLANASNPTSSSNEMQLSRFLALTKDLNVTRSLANSAAIVSLPSTHFDWVRPGIMLYGASPMEGVPASDFDLKPAMQLEAKVIALKTLEAGSEVGYGAIYTCSKRTKMAVIGIGYGDGVARVLDGSACVKFRETLCPIIGRVSMDMITIDVSDVSIEVGDSVEILGPGLAPEVMADAAGTITYEVFSHLSPRLKDRR